MKRKQIIQPNININVDKETPAETIEKLLQVLNPQKQKQEKQKAPAKQKHIDLFLSITDIEELNEHYFLLYKKVKSAIDLSDEQMKRMCEVLLQKYDFEIEELSAMREVEYKQRQAQIEAKNKEQTPWRRSWLWRLIFQPTTNRAQNIIEEEAELEADALFTALEKKLEIRAKTLYKDSTGNAEDMQESAEPEPPPPPARKPRKKNDGGNAENTV